MTLSVVTLKIMTLHGSKDVTLRFMTLSKNTLLIMTQSIVNASVALCLLSHFTVMLSVDGLNAMIPLNHAPLCANVTLSVVRPGVIIICVNVLCVIAPLQHAPL
jgi:hypothetical protein